MDAQRNRSGSPAARLLSFAPVRRAAQAKAGSRYEAMAGGLLRRWQAAAALAGRHQVALADRTRHELSPGRAAMLHPLLAGWPEGAPAGGGREVSLEEMAEVLRGQRPPGGSRSPRPKTGEPLAIAGADPVVAAAPPGWAPVVLKHGLPAVAGRLAQERARGAVRWADVRRGPSAAVELVAPALGPQRSALERAAARLTVESGEVPTGADMSAGGVPMEFRRSPVGSRRGQERFTRGPIGSHMRATGLPMEFHSRLAGSATNAGGLPVQIRNSPARAIMNAGGLPMEFRSSPAGPATSAGRLPMEFHRSPAGSLMVPTRFRRGPLRLLMNAGGLPVEFPGSPVRSLMSGGGLPTPFGRDPLRLAMSARREPVPMAMPDTAGPSDVPSHPARRAPRPALPAGLPLPAPVVAIMERFLGAPFSGVRVHTDTVARRITAAMRADAVAVGTNLFFAPGRFQPDTTPGLALLAHELTHVRQVQTRRAGATPLSMAAAPQAAPADRPLSRPLARAEAQAEYRGVPLSPLRLEMEREAVAMEHAFLQQAGSVPGLPAPALAGTPGMVPAPAAPRSLPAINAAAGRVEMASAPLELHMAMAASPVPAVPAAAESGRSAPAAAGGTAGAASPAEKAPEANAGGGDVDLHKLAEQVARLLERNARLQAERRGVQRWT